MREARSEKKDTYAPAELLDVEGNWLTFTSVDVDDIGERAGSRSGIPLCLAPVPDECVTTAPTTFEESLTMGGGAIRLP